MFSTKESVVRKKTSNEKNTLNSHVGRGGEAGAASTCYFSPRKCAKVAYYVVVDLGIPTSTCITFGDARGREMVLTK